MRAAAGEGCARALQICEKGSRIPVAVGELLTQALGGGVVRINRQSIDDLRLGGTPVAQPQKGFGSCVETVAWAAERKSLLSFFFSLVTVGVYGWYAQRPGWKRYVAVLAGLVLALMCKPAAVTLPAALLILDFWP